MIVRFLYILTLYPCDARIIYEWKKKSSFTKASSRVGDRLKFFIHVLFILFTIIIFLNNYHEKQIYSNKKIGEVFNTKTFYDKWSLLLTSHQSPLTKQVHSCKLIWSQQNLYILCDFNLSPTLQAFDLHPTSQSAIRKNITS